MPYFYLSSMRPLSSLYLLTFLYLYLFPFHTLACYAIVGILAIIFVKVFLRCSLKLCHYISANADDGIMCNSENFV